MTGVGPQPAVAARVALPVPAAGAGELGPDMPDDPKTPGHVLQHLGDIFAEWCHRSATGRASSSGRRGMDNFVARQMVGQRLAARTVVRCGLFIAGLPCNGACGMCLLSLEVLECQLQLVGLAVQPFG